MPRASPRARRRTRRAELKLPAPLTKGSVVASDAFFPFADGLLVAIEAGATAVIQPGGSMRDDEVIKAADEHGIAMVFTGVAAFPALGFHLSPHCGERPTRPNVSEGVSGEGLCMAPHPARAFQALATLSP